MVDEVASSAKRRKKAPLVLGLKVFENISAVEGIGLSDESKRMFAEFERRGLSAEERLAAIRAKHSKKSHE